MTSKTGRYWTFMDS